MPEMVKMYVACNLKQPRLKAVLLVVALPIAYDAFKDRLSKIIAEPLVIRQPKEKTIDGLFVPLKQNG